MVLPGHLSASFLVLGGYKEHKSSLDGGQGYPKSTLSTGGHRVGQRLSAPWKVASLCRACTQGTLHQSPAGGGEESGMPSLRLTSSEGPGCIRDRTSASSSPRSLRMSGCSSRKYLGIGTSRSAFGAIRGKWEEGQESKSGCLVAPLPFAAHTDAGAVFLPPRAPGWEIYG